jgi:nicotinamidase-related amidase
VTASPPGRTDVDLSIAEAPTGFDEPIVGIAAHGFDLRLSKQGWSAFAGTELDEALRARGVTQVVVVGVATSLGVESTARDALELGYHVVVVSDAVADIHPQAQVSSLAFTLPALGQIDTASSVEAMLAER